MVQIPRRRIRSFAAVLFFPAPIAIPGFAFRKNERDLRTALCLVESSIPCRDKHQPKSMSSTYRAIAGEDVSPGDSIPIRLTKPRSPRAVSCTITKSFAGSPFR